MKTLQMFAVGKWGASLAFLCCLALPTVMLAGEKQYPVEGTTTALGTNQQSTGVDNKSVYTHRTYTVKTSSRVFVLQCPNAMENVIGARECGGKRKIDIGDALHLRVEKNYAYVQSEKGKEQRLSVLSESMIGETAQAAKQ